MIAPLQGHKRCNTTLLRYSQHMECKQKKFKNSKFLKKYKKYKQKKSN